MDLVRYLFLLCSVLPPLHLAACLSCCAYLAFVRMGEYGRVIFQVGGLLLFHSFLLYLLMLNYVLAVWLAGGQTVR